MILLVKYIETLQVSKNLQGLATLKITSAKVKIKEK